MKTVLKIDGLVKKFGSKTIIDNLSLEVYGGEVFGFLGPNGAGKTTTIKTVMGFLRPTAGEIFICGKSLKTEYEAAMGLVGGIVENPEVYKDLSGRINLEMYARLHDGVTKERIDEVVSIVGMPDRINEKVKKYSLGMKQRLGLAMAMLHHPKLLILDEPTNGLDPAGIKQLRDILKKLAHEENTAVMVSSHQLPEMELMCDRVGIITKGKLINTLPIHQLLELASQGCRYRFYTKDVARAAQMLTERFAGKMKTTESYIELEVSDEEAPQVNMFLAQQSIVITQFRKQEASLEEAYINVTGGGNTIE